MGLGLWFEELQDQQRKGRYQLPKHMKSKSLK